MNLQELYFINSSTDKFKTYYCTKRNTAVSTTKCRYLALHQYIVTFLIYLLTNYTVDFRHNFKFILSNSLSLYFK